MVDPQAGSHLQHDIVAGIQQELIARTALKPVYVGRSVRDHLPDIVASGGSFKSVATLCSKDQMDAWRVFSPPRSSCPQLRLSGCPVQTTNARKSRPSPLHMSLLAHTQTVEEAGIVIHGPVRTLLSPVHQLAVKNNLTRLKSCGQMKT